CVLEGITYVQRSNALQGMARRCHLQTQNLPMLTHLYGLSVPRPREHRAGLLVLAIAGPMPLYG
ncbi:MAG TPA: hypothetical protein VJ820_12735, partial [Propionibacteriaceae bacterium]|nr:hypothetical protein [Propionibacteriaceae bacterium]